MLLPDLVDSVDAARAALLEVGSTNDKLGASLAELVARIHFAAGKTAETAALCAEAAQRHGLKRPLLVKRLVELHADATGGAAPAPPASPAPKSPRAAEKRRVAAGGVDEAGLVAERAACFFDVLARLHRLQTLEKEDAAADAALQEAAAALEASESADADAAAATTAAAEEWKKTSGGDAAADRELLLKSLAPTSREADEDALVLRVELWARLGVEALRLGRRPRVHHAAARAVGLLPQPPSPAPTPDDRVAHQECEGRAVRGDGTSADDTDDDDDDDDADEKKFAGAVRAGA